MESQVIRGLQQRQCAWIRSNYTTNATPLFFFFSFFAVVQCCGRRCCHVDEVVFCCVVSKGGCVPVKKQDEFEAIGLL